MGVPQSTKSHNDDESGNFTALWLDAGVYSNAENQRTEQKLRKLIDRLKTFDNKNQCEKYIRSSSQEQLLLIVSGRLGRELVPQIHDLPQLKAIYVFCKDKEANKQWAVNFTKIKDVISRVTELISRLQADKESLLGATEIVQSPEKPRSSLAYPYLLCNALLQMKQIETDRTNFIALCRNEYRDNPAQLSIIDEFQQNYTSDTVVWWNTRDSCIRYVLNNALLTQDINTIFLYQFFIRDLYQQIRACQCKSPVKVYRGVNMLADEIKRLKESVGTLTAFNYFLSTTLDYNIAVGFVRNCPADRQSVIFEIDADPEIVKTTPFGDITKYSKRPSEREVLFSIDSIFRITDVQKSGTGSWRIRMTLCSDTDPELKSSIDEIKKRYGSYEEETALISFSQLLREMKEFDEAERYCHRLLQEYSSNKSSLGILYLELAEIASEKNDPDLSHQWRTKATEIQNKIKTGSFGNDDVDESSKDGDKTDSEPIATVLNSSISVQNPSEFRFIDVAAEKHEILLPIEGHEKMPLVSLEEAIEPLLPILPDIRRKAHTAKLRAKEPADGLTPDQSAAIILYTMEWEPRDQCLYFALNARLRAADRNKLKPWFLFLRLILTGLARLPSIQRTVYRGVKLDLTPEHHEGELFFWWGFSSCTTTMNVLKADEFLGNSGKRTFFMIDCVNGKDIRRHSYFQKEEEVLLLPATYFVVKSVFQMATDLHAIQLIESTPQYTYLEPVNEQ